LIVLLFLLVKIEKELGEGCLGEVYSIINIISQKKKALKLIKLITNKNNELEADLKVSLKISNNCKYLVRIEEFFKESDYYYLFMELCENNLENVLKEKRKLPESVFILFFFLL
jgi:serine/threonine protein kinase